MPKHFYFDPDLKNFAIKLSDVEDTIKKGVKVGVQDVLNDWKRESVDITPLDKGTLRKSISTEIRSKGRMYEGSISADATEKSKKYGRFNYAYYIHEVGGEIANPTTPGTVDKFLNEPAEQNEDKWLKMIEDAIDEHLKKGGW